MSRSLGVMALALACTAAIGQEPKPFTLDKLDPAKVPANLRPAKGLPKDVLAALGARGDKVDCLAFRPDGKVLVISGPDQFLRVWDLTGPRFVVSTKLPESSVCVNFSADGKKLAVGDAVGVVRVYEKVETGLPQLKHTLPAHKDGPVWAAVFSPDGKTLATGGKDKAVRLWDLSGKGKVPAPVPLSGHEDEVQAVCFSPDGNWLFSSGGIDEQVRAWDLSGDKPKAGEVTKPGGRVVRLVFSADGTKLVTAGQKGATKVWAVKDGKLSDPVALDTERPVSSVGLAPDGSVAGVVMHSSTEDRIFVWDKDGAKKHELKYDMHLHALAFAPDGRHLAVVTEIQTFLVRLPK